MILRWFLQRRAVRAAQRRYAAGWEWSSLQLARGATPLIVTEHLKKMPPVKSEFDPWLMGAVERIEVQVKAERKQR